MYFLRESRLNQNQWVDLDYSGVNDRPNQNLKDFAGVFKVQELRPSTVNGDSSGTSLFEQLPNTKERLAFNPITN